MRSVLRQTAESAAPVLFGLIADSFGTGDAGLRDAFLIMLVPLALAGAVLATARRTYPRDAARAATARRGAHA